MQNGILAENNKYFCENCNEKVEKAVKFTRITKVPNILMIQMNRFSYDYVKDSRIKIYNKLTFPLYINSSLISGTNYSFEKLENLLEFIVSDNLSSTERGAGGFGSTGKV